MSKKQDSILEAKIAELEARLAKATAFCVHSESHLEICVERRGNALWAVTHAGECLTADGDWWYEPLPSNRDEAFLAATRFPLDKAWALAEAKVAEIKGYAR